MYRSGRVIWVAVLMTISAGCRSVPTGRGAPASGATSPQAAVDQMLAAAQAQDLQAMAAIWGDEQGMTRDRIDRNELERRTIIMSCLMRHDGQKIGAAQLKGASRYSVPVELSQGTNKATTQFEVAQTTSGRWLVSVVDVVPLQAINRGCSGRGG